MIVRWGIDSLSEVLDELGVKRPLLVSTSRWRRLELLVRKRFYGVRPHAEIAGVRELGAEVGDADVLVALGGGSTLDTAKAVSSQRGLPIVSIPTTYSGAEWTEFFGTRDAQAGTKQGGGGARPVAIVYEPRLTVDLSPADSAGTAMNALAHCAEALYAPQRNVETDEHAASGAALIARWLEPVVARGDDFEARTGLLEGAMHAGAALRAGMGVGHAVAQALGGRYGLPHGAMNAVCLPRALEFNREAAAAELRRFAEAIDAGDPIERVTELAELAGSLRLRDYGVPRDELPDIAEAAAARPNAKSNPRPAPPEAIVQLLEAAW
jgi:maleylacetate reductase